VFCGPGSLSDFAGRVENLAVRLRNGVFVAGEQEIGRDKPGRSMAL
jgi:hypothetical protein